MKEIDQNEEKRRLITIEAVAGTSLLAQLPSGKLDRVNARRWSQPGCRHDLYPAMAGCVGGGQAVTVSPKTPQGFQWISEMARGMY